MRSVTVVFLILFVGVFTPLTSGTRMLRMATTTSTDNTGLLDFIAPHFQNDTGIELQWVAVGTGKALVLGRNCDVDILMVHAPEREEEFVENGYGIERHPFMYNDFIIVGPADDPALISGDSAVEAFQRMAACGVDFASRGDNSGTHAKEKQLWREAGRPLPDREQWYIQTGQGMLSTLRIASEREAYTLTDRGTFIKFTTEWGRTSSLVTLVEGDPVLRNQYSVIAVNPSRCSSVSTDLADTFIQWVTSDTGQRLIADFTLGGHQVFFPNASKYNLESR